MTMIFLVFLFITQVISFYFIALLYMKLSKFDDLEKKQSKLMKEMDDAIAVYLTEIKDDNEQLIEKLTAKVEATKQVDIQKQPQKQSQKIQEEEQAPVTMTIPQSTMHRHARQSYEAVQKKVLQEESEVDARTRAIKMSAEGFSIEEIARKLSKGQTEVELILKFK